MVLEIHNLLLVSFIGCAYMQNHIFFIICFLTAPSTLNQILAA